MTAMLLAVLAQAQDIDSDIKRANDADKPQYQVQACEKLRKRGAEAVAPILAWIEKNGRAKMGLIFTQFLAELKDERVSTLLAALVRDKDFFWRPAAMQALAEHKAKAHRELFRAMMKDPLWGVRMGALLGLELLEDKESLAAIQAVLDDPIYDVRAQAAKSMHAFGDETGLPVLVESLKSSVTWFEIDYGQIAREDAWKFLKKLTNDDFGFKPWEPIAQRAPGLAKWEEWIAKKFPKWREMVPEQARCEVETGEYVFGFELRSCQRGDFFFRIDTQNNFVLGYFNLERVPLAKEEREKIDKAIEKIMKVDREMPYGQGGCDFEQYYLKVGEKRFSRLWVGIGGRPPEIDGFIKVVHEIVKSKFGGGEAADFKDRTNLFRGID